MTPLENPDLFWWIVGPLLIAALALVALVIIYRVLKATHNRREAAAEREAAELHGQRVARTDSHGSHAHD